MFLRGLLLILLGGVWVCCHPAAAQQFDNFQGPAILSRGTRPLGRSGGRPIRFRGYVGAQAGYSSGLIRAATDRLGNFVEDDSEFASLSFGVQGTQSGRRSSGGVAYTGNLLLYSNQKYYSGLNQSLSAQYTRRMSRRWSMFTDVSATQQNVAYSLSGAPFFQQYFDRPFEPYNELFDARVYALRGGAGLGYQHTARLSFAMGGGAFTTRRRTAGFVDGDGYSATGEVRYALSRRSGIGASYGFADFFFRRGYGESRAHTVMGQWNRVLNRSWNIGAALGTFYVESDRLGIIQVDPLVTALTGQTSALQAFYDTFRGLAASASLSGQWREHAANFSYYRGANPGNGLYLTSQMQSAGAGYSYLGVRNAGIGLDASWSQMKPLLESVQRLSRFESYVAGAHFSYRLIGGLHFSSGARLGRSKAGGTRFDRTYYQVQAGLSVSSGEVPLVLW
jgi:hypothetical protein